MFAVLGLDYALEKEPEPFHEIDSNYLFERYCAEHFGYLVCSMLSSHMHAWPGLSS